jgi:hypothetical protein
MKTINDWIAKYGEHAYKIIFTNEIIRGGYVNAITLSTPSAGSIPQLPDSRWDLDCTLNNLKTKYDFIRKEVGERCCMPFNEVMDKLGVNIPDRFGGTDLVDNARSLLSKAPNSLKLADVLYATFPFMYDPSKMEHTESEIYYASCLSRVYGFRELGDELSSNDLPVMSIDESSVADRMTIKLITHSNLYGLFNRLSYVYSTNLEINTAKFKPIDPGYNHTLLEVVQQDEQFVGLYRSSYEVHKDYQHRYALVLRNGIVESVSRTDGFYPPYMFTMLDDEFRIARILFAKEVCKYTESFIADLLKANKISNQYVLDNENVGVMESVECE